MRRQINRRGKSKYLEEFLFGIDLLLLLKKLISMKIWKKIEFQII